MLKKKERNVYLHIYYFRKCQLRCEDKKNIKCVPFCASASQVLVAGFFYMFLRKVVPTFFNIHCAIQATKLARYTYILQDACMLYRMLYCSNAWHSENCFTKIAAIQLLGSLVGQQSWNLQAAGNMVLLSRLYHFKNTSATTNI